VRFSPGSSCPATPLPTASLPGSAEPLEGRINRRSGWSWRKGSPTRSPHADHRPTAEYTRQKGGGPEPGPPPP
jgi:hypothetical protein